jgi:hypothetical protein
VLSRMSIPGAWWSVDRRYVYTWSLGWEWEHGTRDGLYRGLILFMPPFLPVSAHSWSVVLMGIYLVGSSPVFYPVDIRVSSGIPLYENYA